MNAAKNFSLSVSIVFHAALIVILLFVKLSTDYPTDKYVELSFGNTGLPGSSGAVGNQLDDVAQVAKKQEEDQTKAKSEEVKKLDLPSAAKSQTEDVIKTAEKKKEKKIKKTDVDKLAANSDINAEGKGNRLNGNGSFGYDIDWGGQGQRKIYNYILPSYPEGVQKQIDIRLKFSIMPDGTVGTIVPLIKADTRLETAAINSLRQWRFEPLAPGQKQMEQTAVIVFPYRLR